MKLNDGRAIVSTGGAVAESQERLEAPSMKSFLLNVAWNTASYWAAYWGVSMILNLLARR